MSPGSAQKLLIEFSTKSTLVQCIVEIITASCTDEFSIFIIYNACCIEIILAIKMETHRILAVLCTLQQFYRSRIHYDKSPFYVYDNTFQNFINYYKQTLDGNIYIYRRLTGIAAK